jgi:XTP/dITP diphosphohydrolase
VKLFLATGNANKIREMKEILRDMPELELLSVRDGIAIPDVVEDGGTFEENAVKKALAIARTLRMPVIADDSGLQVAALGGAPGVLSARYAGEHGNDAANNAKLIADLQGKADRSARFVCVICMALPDGTTHCYRGEVPGVIVDEAQGANGFGYDPHFWLPDIGKTMAELGAAEKNALSHRGRALAALKEHIRRDSGANHE